MAVENARRDHALDNLRTFLTSLVILHHTAIPYGGSGSWLFKSAIFTEPSPPLLLFNAIDQSFFMGLFFCISGRMSAMALRNVSRMEFWQGRVIRLGIPTLLYTLFIQPTNLAIVSPSWNMLSIAQCFSDYWKGMRGVKGPVWYTATLLVLDSVSAACHPSSPQPMDHRAKQTTASTAKHRLIAVCALMGVAIISFGIRVYYPIGTTLRVISVQPGYLPQYLFAYRLGQLSLSTNFPMVPQVETKSGDTSRHNQPVNHLSLKYSILVSGLAFHIIFAPQLLFGGSNWLKQSIADVSGGLNVTALLYSLWNEFSFYLIGSSMVLYFRQKYSQPTKSWLWRPRYSYAAFLVHAPVSITVEMVAERMLSWGMAEWAMLESVATSPLTPVIVAATMSAVNVFISFLLGKCLVELFPGIRKII